jgi:hypothetical protein
MTVKKTLLALSIAAAVAGLSACGGTDATAPAQVASSTSGIAVDDLLVGSTVNCTAPVQSTTTDTAGVFSFALPCTGDLLVVAGTGIDQSTGQAPKGDLRSHAGARVVSPFTTMLLESGLSLADFQILLDKLGLSRIDPNTFNPVGANVSAADKRAAMAIAKVLNDLATTVADDSGDAKKAYKDAAKALSGGNPASLDAAIDAAITAALANSGTYKDSANLANIKLALGVAVKTLVAQIKTAATDDDARKAFDDNDSTSSYVKGKKDESDQDKIKNDVKDDTKFKATRTASFSSVLLSTSPTSGETLTSAQIKDGTSSTSLTLRDISKVTIPVNLSSADVIGSGKEVDVAMQVSDDKGRKLQFAIDRIMLTVGPNLTAKATVRKGAELHFFAQQADGSQVTTTPIQNDADKVYDGIVIDLALIKSRLLGANPSFSTALNQALDLRGKFDVKVVVSEVDVRPAGAATRSPVGSITVGSGKNKQVVGGYTFTGAITFGASGQ